MCIRDRLPDACFSIMQRILAQRTYVRADRLKMLAIEDYGGRKGKSAVMQAVNI